MIAAVVFDLDGLLIDSEGVWDAVREALALERGGHWHPGAQRDMMGMSSPEWSRYMHDRIGLPETPSEINGLVVERMLERYADGPPWLPGALDALRRVARRYRLAVASSSNLVLIQTVLDAGDVTALFAAVVSSEEVARGKPAPDVYLEAARRLAVASVDCVAVEDSASGIRSAKAAGMRCIAVPNLHFPPGEALAQADLVLESVVELDTDTVASLDRAGEAPPPPPRTRSAD